MKVAVVGGGAAGFFAALSCADANPAAEITIFERSSQFLGKVRISGGGRCNVTHAPLPAREFVGHYPRGSRALISPLTRFGPEETAAWFERRGVRLKTEADGRLFPITDSSGTVIDCFLHEAHMAGVKVRHRSGVISVKIVDHIFELGLANHERFRGDRLLLATGGTRSADGALLAQSLGHRLNPPVPSLFSFETAALDWRKLAGLSIGEVELSLPATKLRARGPLLFTHRGISGPAVLRLSAWGAREFFDRNYRFTLHIDWLPRWSTSDVEDFWHQQHAAHPTKRIMNSPPDNLPQRCWEVLTQASGVDSGTTWSNFPRAGRRRLLELLRKTEIEVDGQSLNKDEFVTCGGVDLREVDFQTMQSRIVPGLFFAGEVLDIDGITGGFNFQSAWTTGWIAGNAMAKI